MAEHIAGKKQSSDFICERCKRFVSVFTENVTMSKLVYAQILCPHSWMLSFLFQEDASLQ